MAITLIGTFLDNQFYQYVTGSYKRSFQLKNSSSVTQTSKTFSVLGTAPEIHAITLHLGNTYPVYSGTTWGLIVGSTNWLGVSRLAFFKNMIGALGASLPMTFVSPDGMTHSVVPMGSIDVEIFNPDNITPEGAEYRVSITLEDLT